MRITKIHIAIFVCILTKIAPCLPATPPVNADQLEKLWQRSSTSHYCFLKKTLIQRTGFSIWNEYFTDDDRTHVMQIAKQTAAEIKEVIAAQQTALRQIEDYEGDDWDRLYGVTGLWRKCLIQTMQNKRRWISIQLDHAATLPNEKRDALLMQISAEIKSSVGINEIFRNISAAKINWLKGKSKKAVITALDDILSKAKSQSAEFIEGSIFRLSINDDKKLSDIYSISDQIDKASLKDDMESLFILAAHEIALGKKTLLEKLSQKHKGIEHAAGSVFIARLRNSPADNFNLIQSELTAAASLTQTSDELCGILESLITKQKHRTPLIYFAAAQACSKTQPEKSALYYLQAASDANDVENIYQSITATEALRRAALLRYSVYQQQPSKAEIALATITAYINHVKGDPDRQLEYFYATLLANTGQNNKARPILTRLSKSNSQFADHAKLELLYLSSQAIDDNQILRNEIIKRFENFLNSSAKSDRYLRTRATELYCKLLLEQGSDQNPLRVLELIEKNLDSESFNAKMLKATALTQADRLTKAIPLLAELTNSENCKLTKTASAAVFKTLEKIDEYEEETADYQTFIAQCLQLITNCIKCTDSEELINYYTPIIIELKIIHAGDNISLLAPIETILEEKKRTENDKITWLRCQARLLLAQKKYSKAFTAWSQIADNWKPAALSTQRPVKWWRAKYYSLLAWSKIPQNQNTEVIRAIDILLNRANNASDFWKNKLVNLKFAASKL